MFKKIIYAFLFLFFASVLLPHAVKNSCAYRHNKPPKPEGQVRSRYLQFKKAVIKSYLKMVPLKFRKYFHFNNFTFNIPFKNIKIYSVQINISNPRFSGYHTAIMKLSDKKNGVIKGIDDISFKAEIYAPVAVASQTIGKFQIIKSGDFKIAYKNIAALNDGYYLGGKGLAGREAKFFIARDSALTNGNTERKRIVNFGNAVNIVYKKYGLILKTKGMALQAGALNSSIRVKNIESGVILNCIVKSNKIVAVR